ncbi:HemX protein [[Haemophilus] felis]|nr:HemX protein [[Haemophilus] felis]
MTDNKITPSDTSADSTATESDALSSQFTETEPLASEQSTERSKQEDSKVKDESKTETVVIKKGGTGLALLAILIALGMGGAGFYFGQQQVEDIQQKILSLDQKVGMTTVDEKSNFDTELQQLETLKEATTTTQEKLNTLQQLLDQKEQTLASLQQQINSINKVSKPEQPNDWLLSEADFLLNNALRKLVLDNDIDTAIALLKLADETLEKVSDPRVAQVRSLLNSDLKQLLSIDSVDQNMVMQNLSQLANTLDELEVLNVNFDDTSNNEKLSDSLDDWKANAEKSAISFLNHFIRIKPRTVNDKALLAPNQDIYLRENIRLRLQIAILAVPRQQDDLYKQSLEAVAAWVRTYFDTNTTAVQDFLKTVDELSEQSIYIDTPSQLASLSALDKLLERQSQEVKKIEISANKTLTEQNAPEATKEPEAKKDPEKSGEKANDASPTQEKPAEQ